MKITVVKIGGNVVDNPQALARFVDDFSRMPGYKVLVHGGGKEATRLSAKLGIETNMIDGRRVTDADTLEVVTMVYGGLVNKRVVCKLQAAGCDAIGLTGADGKAITATRRSPVPIDYGFVGDINTDGVNSKFVIRLCEAGVVPVMCALMYDGNGGLLNCNADSVATGLALGLAGEADVDLVYCFEKAGVLRDIDDPESVIREITPSSYQVLKADGVISKGMIPKIENSLNAVANGIKSVRICHSDDLLTDKGTVIKNA